MANLQLILWLIVRLLVVVAAAPAAAAADAVIADEVVIFAIKNVCDKNYKASIVTAWNFLIANVRQWPLNWLKPETGSESNQ